MSVIDGNALAEELHASIQDELQILRMSAVQPGLATVVIGEDYGAKAYERHVHRLADELEYGYVCASTCRRRRSSPTSSPRSAS